MIDVLAAPLFLLLIVLSSAGLRELIRPAITLPLAHALLLYIGASTLFLTMTGFFFLGQAAILVLAAASLALSCRFLFQKHDTFNFSKPRAISQQHQPVRLLTGILLPLRKAPWSWLLLAMLTVSLLHNLAFPYEGWDGYQYHLPLAFEFSTTGGYDLSPTPLNLQDFMYRYRTGLFIFTESFLAFGLFFAPGLFAIFPTVLLAVFLAAAWPFLRMFADEKKSACGLVLLSVTPLFVYHGIINYTDLLHASFILAGVYWILRLEQQKRQHPVPRKEIVFASLFLGFAILVKAVMAAFAGATILFFLIRLPKNRLPWLLAPMGMLVGFYYTMKIILIGAGWNLALTVNRAPLDIAGIILAMGDAVLSIGRSADFAPFFYPAFLGLLLLRKKDAINQFLLLSILSFFLLFVGLSIAPQPIAVGFRRFFFLSASALALPAFLHLFWRQKTFRAISILFIAFLALFSATLLFARSDFNSNLNHVILDVGKAIQPTGKLTTILNQAQSIPLGVLYTQHPDKHFRIDLEPEPGLAYDYELFEGGHVPPAGYTAVYDNTITVRFPKETRHITIYKKQSH